MMAQEAEDRGKTGQDPNRKGRSHGIERIVVALDPSAHSLAALEAAVRMAARLDADLQALFVEDVNVRRLADLPFVEEVGLYTGTCRRVETQHLSRQLRVQAVSVRRRFRMSTQHLGISCTFREVRGRVVSEVLGAAAEADVVVVGKGAWSPFETRRLAPAVRSVLGQASTSTLVLRAGSQVEPPMRVVYDGSAPAQRALTVAAKLATDEDGHLMIFVLADDPEVATGLEAEVQEQLADAELILSFHQLTEASVSRLSYIVAHEERGTLLLPVGTGALEDEALLDFLEDTEAPVLLIR